MTEPQPHFPPPPPSRRLPVWAIILIVLGFLLFALVVGGPILGLFTYYAGSSFLERSSLAQSATIASQGQQIAAAWTLRSNDMGNDYDRAAGHGDLNELIPSYLLELPTPPLAATSEAYRAVNLAELGAGERLDGVILPLSLRAEGICRDLAGATDGDPTPTSAPTRLTLPAEVRYSCVFHDASGNGKLDEGEPMWFVYKVR